MDGEWLRQRLLAAQRSPPLISALMVTRDRPGLAALAIACFRAQRYPAKELVVLDHAGDHALADLIESLDDPAIRYFPEALPELSIGELRNRTVALARGDYICQWDDDDLSHPDRLATQMALLQDYEVDACLLWREWVWWPRQRRLAVSVRRFWEHSILCRRARLPTYPAVRCNEDTPVIERLIAEGRVALLDAPHLYTYVHHGINLCDANHFEEHWRAATGRWVGEGYEAWLRRMEQELPIRDYLALLAGTVDTGDGTSLS